MDLHSQSWEPPLWHFIIIFKNKAYMYLKLSIRCDICVTFIEAFKEHTIFCFVILFKKYLKLYKNLGSRCNADTVADTMSALHPQLFIFDTTAHQ